MLKVMQNSVDSLMIQWSDLKGDTFTLYRSTSPKDGYEILKVNYPNVIYIDNEINLRDIGRRYYYKVEGYIGGVRVSEEKGETTKYNTRDRIANKVIHESQVVLRVMKNPPVKVLLKRRDGKPCPNCWNPVTKKVRFANCNVCNGTGVLLGYHNPIETLISRDISQLVDYTSMLDSDKTNLTGVNAWITNYPLVSPGDVIADIMEQRFLIERVIQRTHSQSVIRQILDLTPLEKGHPAYSVDIDWSDLIER